MFFLLYSFFFSYLPLPPFLSSIFHGGWLVGHSHWAVKSLSRLQGVQRREFDWPLGSRSSAWWLLVTANYPQFFAGLQTKRPDALLSLTSVTVQFAMPSNMFDIMARNLCLPLAGFPNISTVCHWLSKQIVPPPTHSIGNIKKKNTQMTKTNIQMARPNQYVLVVSRHAWAPRYSVKSSDRTTIFLWQNW